MRPATATSVRWSVEHARGSVALVVGFADASIAAALAGEGMTVTLAVPKEAGEAIEAGLAEVRGPARQRLTVVASGLDLSGFESRAFDVVVVGDGLSGETGPATVEHLGRVIDGGGCLVIAPEGGPPAAAPERVTDLLDALYADFRVERLDVFEPSVALLAHRWGDDEERPESRRALDGEVLVTVARDASERAVLIEGLRAGHLARDRALAGLEAELARRASAPRKPVEVAREAGGEGLESGLARLGAELERAERFDSGGLERVLSELEATLADDGVPS